ncbi:hypothetical protein CF70_034365 [Cupriavidus sp. SK-3]|uniref:hypothetical protein n=1 Tax=Cupriavidus sp. SK-3 TaxID=1470558 RepID=UPI00044DFFC7|nr:hypothetical protein [Cupriavidus sp. SK-3]KDP87799.1 hypothetical protein CF70_034365 [Cupriavidus sp. SK-3]
MSELDPGATATMVPSGLPYFTDADPSLSRSAGGRDPLGLLPVWSAFGRRLVPNLASPVFQVNGIKAVVLIEWLALQKPIQSLLDRDERVRGYFRLMEGLIEYWLFRNNRPHCFGTNSLTAAKGGFTVDTRTTKTVANGLFQYYRGSCRRAGFLADDGTIHLGAARELARIWPQKAINELAGALGDPLKTTVALVPAVHLEGTALSRALDTVFSDEALSTMLREELFGQTAQRQLALDFLQLRRLTTPGKLRLDERIARLASSELRHAIDCVQWCEPFLLVMQDVFDLLRASPGKRLDQVAAELKHLHARIASRATNFLRLRGDLDSRRMKQMLVLAETLAGTSVPATGATDNARLVAFMREMVLYHARCMTERARDPLVLIEGEVVVAPVAADRDPADAKARLQAGYPWMNDYYLNTASSLYGQVFKDAQ